MSLAAMSGGSRQSRRLGDQSTIAVPVSPLSRPGTEVKRREKTKKRCSHVLHRRQIFSFREPACLPRTQPFPKHQQNNFISSLVLETPFLFLCGRHKSFQVPTLFFAKKETPESRHKTVELYRTPPPIVVSTAREREASALRTPKQILMCSKP